MPRKFKIWVERDEYGELPELDEEDIERLKKKAINYCVFKISDSDQSRKSLEDKMRRKGAPQEVIDHALDYMEQEDFINDRRLAGNYVSAKKDDKRGDRYIANYLRQKGLDAAMVAEVLEEQSDPDKDYENALEFGRSAWRSLSRWPEQREKSQRLTRKLITRGYDFDIAFRVFDELWAEHLAELEEETITEED